MVGELNGKSEKREAWYEPKNRGVGMGLYKNMFDIHQLNQRTNSVSLHHFSEVDMEL